MSLKEFQEIGKIDIPEIRIPDNKPELIGIQPVPEGIKLELSIPFWKQSGFKRGLGAGLMIIGGIMSLIPTTVILGTGISVIGGLIGGVGIYSAAANSKPNINGNKGLFEIIIEFLQKLLEAFKKVKKV
jgi:hypothetical protein